MQDDGSINVNAGDDYSVEGEIWNFRLKATSTISTINPGNVAMYDFSVPLLDGCLNDELSSPSIIDDFVYYIAYTGSHFVTTPTYTQTLQNCPISWKLVAIENGLEIPLSATQ